MFRCITELKGLVIDFDSFGIGTLDEWKNLGESYALIFLTSDSATEKILVSKNFTVYKLGKFEYLFAPSIKLNDYILDKQHLLNTEITYVSKNLSFLKNAMTLLNGTIWVTSSINYAEASTLPDLVCRSIDRLERDLKSHTYGYLGETGLYPLDKRTGLVIPISFSVSSTDDEDVVPMYILGRYFGYSHYMSQLHTYSSAIYLNKKRGWKTYGAFIPVFEKLYELAVNNVIKRYESVNAICSIPVRPSEDDRFAPIMKYLSDHTGLENISGHIKCLRDYPAQKSLSLLEREENVSDIFQADEDLAGKTVLLIDDIVTTGSTVRACIHELRKKNVNGVVVLALAVNQKEGTYWSSEAAGVYCPICNEKMKLFYGNNGFFFSCPNDSSTYSYFEGMKQLIDHQNNAEERKQRFFQDNSNLNK